MTADTSCNNAGQHHQPETSHNKYGSPRQPPWTTGAGGRGEPRIMPPTTANYDTNAEHHATTRATNHCRTKSLTKPTHPTFIKRIAITAQHNGTQQLERRNPPPTNYTMDCRNGAIHLSSAHISGLLRTYHTAHAATTYRIHPVHLCSMGNHAMAAPHQTYT